MFLATTALEKFWETRQPILFLGEWCRLYSRRQHWQELKAEVLPDPWEDIAEVERANAYCLEVYRAAILEITAILNRVHDVQKQPIYYEIILGNWLQYYIHQLYDKFVCLKEAFRLQPNLTTVCLDPSEHYVPVELADMAQRLSSDADALQHYSQILECLGHEFPIKRLGSFKQPDVFECNGGTKRFIYRQFTQMAYHLNAVLHDECIVVTDPSFYRPLPTAASLMWRSRFKIVVDAFAHHIRVPFQVNRDLRANLKMGLADDEFTAVLSALLFRNIPAIYIEAYSGIVEQLKGKSIRRSSMLHTAVGLHFNLPFKFFAAEHYDEFPLTGHQYGGGYGVDMFCAPEAWERSIVRRYYTWGWQAEQAKFLPHPKLLPPKMQKEGTGCVLLSMTTWTRNLSRFECHVTGHNFLKKTLEPTQVFYHQLNPEIELKIRFHRLNYGWSIEERFLESGAVFTKDETPSFRDGASKARICVFDHLGTGYIESLAWNIPTLVFIDKSAHKLRVSVRAIFDELERVGILHYSPEFAASHLNAVHDDVTAWWNSDVVQSARTRFVRELGRTSPNWVAEWQDEFERLIRETSNSKSVSAGDHHA